MREDIVNIEKGGENVFADIGVRDPEDSLLRAELAMKIAETVARRGLTQADIGRLLRVDQSKVSKLVRGKISGFTSDRLFRYLAALGFDVSIKLKATGGRRGRLKVIAA